MQQIVKGQRLALQDLTQAGVLQLAVGSQGLNLDFACFGLDKAGKLSDDRYMTFFNQPQSPCGGVEQQTVAAGPVFRFQLNRLPLSIERLVLSASVDGTGTLAELKQGFVRLQDGSKTLASFEFQGSDFVAERAVMLVELYRKAGEWRLMAVGQGFNGGLQKLVEHFGGSVSDAPAAAAPIPSSASSAPADASSVRLAKRVSLTKRINQQAPQLVSLVKQAGVSLAKAGLGEHQARVCLVLDISGSMYGLYQKGLVQAFAERILALGCQFDDDGEIDVFLFGERVHQPQAMTISNFRDYVRQAIDAHPLEGNTRYGLAMQAVRQHYFPDSRADSKTLQTAALPVYVMFVTDGTTSDPQFTENQLRASSYEPIFWQFMGIGKSRKAKSKNRLLALFQTDFEFLEKLDDLSGRFIDNADFFSTESPDEYPDSELYQLLMTEYPEWLKQARQKGLLR